MYALPGRQVQRHAISLGLPLLFLLACSDNGSDTTDIDPINPAGTWTFHFVNTQANGVCADEAHDVSDETVVITATGTSPNYSITAKGFIGLQSNQLSGTFNNNQLSMTGEYSEDGGVTTSTHTLHATSATTLAGTENWSWSGPGGVCPGGKATVTATLVD